MRVHMIIMDGHQRQESWQLWDSLSLHQQQSRNFLLLRTTLTPAAAVVVTFHNKWWRNGKTCQLDHGDSLWYSLSCSFLCCSSSSRCIFLVQLQFHQRRRRCCQPMRDYRLPTSPRFLEWQSWRITSCSFSWFNGLDEKENGQEEKEGVEGDYEYELYLLQRSWKGTKMNDDCDGHNDCGLCATPTRWVSAISPIWLWLTGQR